MCWWHRSSPGAGSGWGKCPGPPGFVPLLCHSLPRVPGNPCWVCPSAITGPTSTYGNIDFTLACPYFNLQPLRLQAWKWYSSLQNLEFLLGTSSR